MRKPTDLVPEDVLIVRQTGRCLMQRGWTFLSSPVAWGDKSIVRTPTAVNPNPLVILAREYRDLYNGR